ncbi:MAG: phytoene desaturase family protein [Paracoccaceae bacterium]|nr:phytoene desaturase family protein [Paracoccaceae bacterium]
MVKNKIVVVGAGIGGLASTLELAHQGHEIEVFETHGMPGGKMRTIDSPSGMIDAGPTVLTLKHIFEKLFADVGEDINKHLQLSKDPVLARHFWPDGTKLDLSSDAEENYKTIKAFGGQRSLNEFKKFNKLTRCLYESFDFPILQNPKPSITNTILQTSHQSLNFLPALLPGRTLANLVNSHFTDIRLRQLFSRYATYVGGSPFNSPAILSLIWQAESRGVWRIIGGMHKLARKIHDLAKSRGAKFNFNTSVSEILITKQKVEGVRLSNGKEILCNSLIFNGDPNAIFRGFLGQDIRKVVAHKNVKNRSLSAYVWTFSAKPSRSDLVHHNVFFNKKYKSEFTDISSGTIPKDPALYVCAQNLDDPNKSNSTIKFEIIMNASPVTSKNFNEEEEFKICQEITFGNLNKMGLTFNPIPSTEALTTPQKFNKLFPASNGSLYGLSPQNFMTTFKRPQARTKVRGLYLAGGGVHPGPGIPMALLSGRHAAAAIMKDQTLT